MGLPFDLREHQGDAKCGEFRHGKMGAGVEEEERRREEEDVGGGGRGGGGIGLAVDIPVDLRRHCGRIACRAAR